MQRGFYASGPSCGLSKRRRRGAVGVVRLALQINPLQRRKDAAAAASTDAVDKSIVDSGHGRSFDRLATAVRAVPSASAVVQCSCITRRSCGPFIGPAVTCVWAIKGVARGPRLGTDGFTSSLGQYGRRTGRRLAVSGTTLDWRLVANPGWPRLSIDYATEASPSRAAVSFGQVR
jgi:hypothetical protein